jgi:hypothetical protein
MTTSFGNGELPNSRPMGLGPVGGGQVESQIALDMVRRSLPFIPVVLLLSALVWGRNGAISAGLALAVVLVNFLLAAATLSWAARISVGAVMGAALFGYLLRLVLIAAVVLPLRNQSWFEPVPLGITLIVTHLGLLLWELRHVSISFSQPGVKQSAKRSRASANHTSTTDRSES